MRLTRQAEIKTTMKVRTMPRVKAITTFTGFATKAISRANSSPNWAKAWPRTLDHHPADPDAEQAAQGARHEGVERTLKGEHADQVPALHPDAAGDAELPLAFGGEHHEDQENKQVSRPPPRTAR